MLPTWETSLVLDAQQLSCFSSTAKLLRSEDLGVCLKRVGAVDSCVVLRAGHVLTGHKEKEERKNKLRVHYCDFCKSPFFVCIYRENIPRKNETEAWTCLIHHHPCGMWGWWWYFEVLCSALDQVAESIPSCSIGRNRWEKINIYCESRLNIRRNLFAVWIWLLPNISQRTSPH